MSRFYTVNHFECQPIHMYCTAPLHLILPNLFLVPRKIGRSKSSHKSRG